MFTGLIRAVGEVLAAEEAGGGLVLEVGLGGLAEPAPGDSIAVDGCCLTVVAAGGGQGRFELTGETLARTTLGEMAKGRRVNLEPALRFGDPLGGHLVLGHVDCTGTLVALTPGGGGATLEVAAPEALRPLLAEKGSVAVDGISLTVAGVAGGVFSVAVIPETLARTALADREVGGRVNLEADPLARYALGSWSLPEAET